MKEWEWIGYFVDLHQSIYLLQLAVHGKWVYGVRQSGSHTFSAIRTLPLLELKESK